jgi:Holliday junction resolvase RusA-like endonuclease
MAVGPACPLVQGLCFEINMKNFLTDSPPESGEIEFSIERAPVSLQAKGNRKREFKEHVAARIAKAGFLLSGDVSVRIQWNVHEQKRYETGASADVDNIVKPLLDAICGPKGIMIDDTQFQAIECFWVDSYEYDREQIDIRIKYIPDEYLPKKGLAFVCMDKNLCIPFWQNLQPEELAIFISAHERMLTRRDEMMDTGKSYYESKGVMSVQRVFHKSRLQGFDIENIGELKKSP